MKILVCISKVPDTTSKIAFTGDNTSFDTNGVQFIINPYPQVLDPLTPLDCFTPQFHLYLFEFCCPPSPA